MNYDDKLKELKVDLDKATNLKYKAEAKLEQLNNQEQDLRTELKGLEVEPEDLGKEILKLEEEINLLFEKASQLLPKDLL